MKFKEFLSEGINDKGIFKAVMMAGSSASGKSYVLKQITSGSVSPKIVNTDAWTEYYMKFGDFSWDKYGAKTKVLTKAQLSNYLNSMLPMWIDGTSSNPSAVLRRKGILQSIGYDVGFIFIDTPVDTAIERNEKRGRTVDVDFLKRSYKESQRLKEYYRSEFKFFKEILNGEGELIDKVILSAYRSVSTFFDTSIINPIGVKLKNDMLKNGWKYLIDTPEYDKGYLNKLIDNWYKK